MADSVDIDLYADVEQDFPQEDFSGENNDLYDDVITAGSNKEEEKNPVTPKKESLEVNVVIVYPLPQKMKYIDASLIDLLASPQIKIELSPFQE